MNGFPVIMIGASLAIILVITVFILALRKRRPSTPEGRYQHDIREIQMDTYRQTKPRPARQLGNPEARSMGIGGGGGGGAGLV